MAGLVDAEQVDEQRPGALDGQTGELVAAGDQDQAGRYTGQQRPDLLGVAGVVEQYQYPLAGQVAAVQRDLALEVGRYLLDRYAEGFQEPADDRGRGPGRPGGREALQVDGGVRWDVAI